MSDPTTGAHPDIELLSDLEAGLLDGDPAAEQLRAHVADCASCTDVVGMLRDTQGMLADLPAVEVPDDVAARIDTALAAEAATRPAAEPAVPAGVTVLADRANRHRRSQAGRRWWPGAGVVAAGVALLFAGAIGLSAVQNHSGKSAGKSSAAAAGDRRVPTARVPVASGQDYTPTTLTPGVRRLLFGQISPQGLAAPGATGSPARTNTDQAVLSPDPAFARFGRPGVLTACVAELAGSPTVRPLAIDFARFQGKPAVVVVLPDIDPAKVDAWVVGPDCRPGQADLLRFQVVPRVG